MTLLPVLLPPLKKLPRFREQRVPVNQLLGRDLHLTIVSKWKFPLKVQSGGEIKESIHMQPYKHPQYVTDFEEPDSPKILELAISVHASVIERAQRLLS